MPTSPHVIVTGGTGLVGTSVTKALLDYNFSVTVLSRKPPRQNVGHPKLSWIHVDLKRFLFGDLRCVPQADYVVHAAAVIQDRSDSKSLDELLRVNVAATEELFSWCSMTGVSKVIFISSLSVLRRPLQTPISETHPVGPCTPYAMSKLFGEEILRRKALEGGYTPIILRISSPIPCTFEELPCTVVRTWLEAASRGRPLCVFGSGQRSQDFVSCHDVASAVVRAIKSPNARGIYHIGSGKATSMLELAQLISRCRSVQVTMAGFDTLESERWEISLERAHQDLGYIPEFPGLVAIETMAQRGV